MPTTMNSTLPTPAMMPTASMMPESSEMSSAGMAAAMPNELNRYSAAVAMPARDDGAGNLLVRDSPSSPRTW